MSLGSDSDTRVDPIHYPTIFYVRVSATEAAESTTTEDLGPDIDAVILNSGGTNFNANYVELLTDMSTYTNYKARDPSTAGTTINAFTETDPTKITADST